MRNFEGACAALCLYTACAACAAPVAAQTMPDGAVAAVPPCQNIVGQAEIDGTLQQVTGLACQQPDGSWQFVQGDENSVAYYPPPYAYYYPWYWGGFVTVVGGSFIFIDRFHHHYPMNHVYFSRVSYGTGVRVHGWHGANAMHSGGWGVMQHGGGGMHR
jgi:surface antigen